MLETGIDWCSLSVTSELRLAVSLARKTDIPIRDCLGEDDEIVRVLVTRRVATTAQMAGNPAISMDDLLADCFSLRGEPWGEASARRDMRELIRVYRHIQGSAELPKDADQLMALWSEATAGEVPLYLDNETPHFRTRTPFSHGDWLFDSGEVKPGFETVAPGDIPTHVEMLLSFINNREGIVELRTAVALFALEHIHPFADGNGRLGRMLACSMLADAYPTPILIALVAQLQRLRGEVGRCMSTIVRDRTDLGPFASLFLDALRSAQEDVTRIAWQLSATTIT